MSKLSKQVNSEAESRVPSEPEKRNLNTLRWRS